MRMSTDEKILEALEARGKLLAELKTEVAAVKSDVGTVRATQEEQGNQRKHSPIS